MKELYRRVIIEPDENAYNCKGARNPACAREGDTIHVIFRASDMHDHGTLGYARLDLEHNILERSAEPVLAPSMNFDRYGAEDPKLVRWEDGWLLLYHAIGTDRSWTGVGTAAAYTRDFRHIRKLGVMRPFVPSREILPRATGLTRPALLRMLAEYSEQPGLQTLWGKDVVLFPEQFDGDHLAIYRLPPAICIAPLDDLTGANDFWRSECLDPRYLLLSPEYSFETRCISPSAPPILTRYGWLLVFHCIDSGPDGNARYTASAALLGSADPRRVLGRLPEPLLEPEHAWEYGDWASVYVSSVDVRDDTLYVYYGAADVRSAVAAFALGDVVAAMR